MQIWILWKVEGVKVDHSPYKLLGPCPLKPSSSPETSHNILIGGGVGQLVLNAYKASINHHCGSTFYRFDWTSSTWGILHFQTILANNANNSFFLWRCKTNIACKHRNNREFYMFGQIFHIKNKPANITCKARENLNGNHHLVFLL